MALCKTDLIAREQTPANGGMLTQAPVSLRHLTRFKMRFRLAPSGLILRCGVEPLINKLAVQMQEVGEPEMLVTAVRCRRMENNKHAAEEQAAKTPQYSRRSTLATVHPRSNVGV